MPMIDVRAFLEGSDISPEVKARVLRAGEGNATNDAEATRLYRRMQAQILIELGKLENLDPREVAPLIQ